MKLVVEISQITSKFILKSLEEKMQHTLRRGPWSANWVFLSVHQLSILLLNSPDLLRLLERAAEHMAKRKAKLRLSYLSNREQGEKSDTSFPKIQIHSINFLVSWLRWIRRP